MAKEFSLKFILKERGEEAFIQMRKYLFRDVLKRYLLVIIRIYISVLQNFHFEC